MTTSDKVHADRLRRMAARQGLTLQKSRRRDPLATDYGTFGLYQGEEPIVVGLSIDQVENHLARRSDRDSDHSPETVAPATDPGATPERS